MNAAQIVIMIFGGMALGVINMKFHKRYIILANAHIAVGKFSSASTRKTRNVYKILLGLVMPRSYRHVMPDTSEADLKKMLLVRTTIMYGFYCLTVIGLVILGYVFAG